MMDRVRVRIGRMIAELQSSVDDAEKFDRGIDVAGTRLRRDLMRVRDEAQITRMEILDWRRERKMEEWKRLTHNKRRTV